MSIFRTKYRPRHAAPRRTSKRRRAAAELASDTPIAMSPVLAVHQQEAGAIYPIVTRITASAV